MSDEFTAGGCNPSDCASCGGGCSSAGGCDPVENHKTITLTMEDDTEALSYVISIIMMQNRPSWTSPAFEDTNFYFILFPIKMEEIIAYQ